MAGAADGAATLRLASLHAVPAECNPAGTDCRRLGVALTQLRLDDTSVPLDDARFVAGWHTSELGLRWTNGAGLLDVGGASVVELRLAATALRYAVPARADRIMAA